MNENQNEYVDINAHDNYPDSEQKIEVPTMKVIPLKKICMTIGELPSSYLETMTYYEMLVWFINYLRYNIIPTVNGNAAAVQEVQNVVMELQNYINDYKDSIDSDVEELEEYMNNYFENLDVQEEINNKLDQMLEDGVLTEIIQQFLQSTAIWCFDTVADMKQATNLINGSFARTLGYYSVNDGGEGTYKITDTESQNDYQEELTSGLYATLIIDDIVNIKQLGAYGDGTHDDGLILNKAITYAVNNGYNVYIPSGVYLTSIPINVYGGGGGEKTFILYGDGSLGSIIKSTASGINVIELKALENNTAEHVYIKNISIDGNTNALNGICILNDLTNSKLENITIRNCTQYGLTNNVSGTIPNVYLDSFNKIRIDNCSTGFRIDPGSSSNTSLNFQDCYVQNCTNAYYLCAIYSNMINCCADNITGNVFEFYYWKGSIINCGTEAYQALNTFVFSHTQATVIDPFCYGNYNNALSTHLYLKANSQITIIGGRLLVTNHDTSTFPGKLYELESLCQLDFYNVTYNNYETDDVSASGRYVNIHKYTGNVNQRDTRHLPFIGIDTSESNGLINENHTNNNISNGGNAIYFGLGTTENYTYNDINLSQNRKNFKGDILLSREPKTIGGIGWIQAGDTTELSRWTQGEYLKIPVIHAGDSSSRPTGTAHVIGQCYFDTTLGKPIWWKGSYWVDATGTQV